MNYFDYVQINSVNPVYLINGETDGCIDTLNLVSTNKSKKVFIKYIELWNECKYLIKTINGGEAGEY